MAGRRTAEDGYTVSTIRSKVNLLTYGNYNVSENYGSKASTKSGEVIGIAQNKVQCLDTY